MNGLLYITWDPIKGIPIGGFTLHFYSLLWVCAFALGWYIMTKLFAKDRINKEWIDPLFMYFFFGCLIGMRLGEYLFYDETGVLFSRPWEVFLPISYSPGDSIFFGLIENYTFSGFSGLASHGATIGILIAMILFAKFKIKKPIMWVLDRICIPVAIGGALVRVGNFVNSEIVGAPWDGAWAVLMPQQSLGYGPIVPRHPSQLYEAIGYILLFVALRYIFFKTEKRKNLGFIFGWFWIVLFGIRFVVEFTKEAQGAERVANALEIGLNNGQILSIPFILAGFVILYVSKFNYYDEK